MKKKSFIKSLQPKDRYMVCNLYFLYFIQGIFVLLLGSILPMMREEYGFSYDVSGYLISAHNIGNVIMGFFAGIMTLRFGMKRSLTIFNIVIYIGWGITLVTGNPVLLIIAILMTGLGRGIVSNYNNQVISDLSQGSATPLNILHACFAVGAVLAPVLTLLCSKQGNHGWRYTVYVLIAFGILSIISNLFMDMSSVTPEKTEGGSTSLGFLKDRLFLKTMGIMFFYLCVEASVMGWMVTYYTDSGVFSENTTQILTSVLWITILVGRFSCSILGKHMLPSSIIRILSLGILVFLMLLVGSHSAIPMLIATIGLGLSMSGMYGTTVANAGTVFAEYPMAMSVFVLITAMGSVFTPTIIGNISNASNIRTGMAVLIIPAIVLNVLAFINRKHKK